MSTKNKKSVAAQALLEMDSITSAIKEESKNSLKNLLRESVISALREGCENEEDEEEVDIYDENDAENDEEKDSKDAKSDVDEDDNEQMMNGGQSTPQAPMGAGDDMAAQEAPAATEGPVDMEAGAEAEAGEGEGEDDFSQYQVGDDTYDLTGEKDYNNVVKVYKLLNDEDQVVIQKDGNTLQLKDDAAGTEYVIDLGADDEDASAEAVESGADENMGLNESNIAGFDDEEDTFDEFDDDEFDVPNGSQPWDDEEESTESKIDRLQAELDMLRAQSGENEDELMFSRNINENKKARRPMKESKEMLFEVDLGYTDNYQDKDPIAGLSNNEPSKSGKSWHKGVPTGTSKPWAGETKSKGDPFKKTEKVEGSVNEEDMPMGDDIPMEEQMNVGGFVQQNSVTTSRVPNSNGRKARSMRGTKTTGSADPRYGSANESKSMAKVMAENANLKKENKELKEAILAFRKDLKEAYVTNANLGKITKLFLENTTSQSEKVDIVNRFANEAKTVEQSKALYESINRELKKTNKTININESSMSTANGSKMLNETKVYKSNDLLKTIDFMNRVMNC